MAGRRQVEQAAGDEVEREMSRSTATRRAAGARPSTPPRARGRRRRPPATARSTEVSPGVTASSTTYRASMEPPLEHRGDEGEHDGDHEGPVVRAQGGASQRASTRSSGTPERRGRREHGGVGRSNRRGTPRGSCAAVRAGSATRTWLAVTSCSTIQWLPCRCTIAGAAKARRGARPRRAPTVPQSPELCPPG